MNITKLALQIAAFTNKEHGKGADQGQVSDAESTLGVVFSESYRSFLRTYGWAKFSYQEMYGLGDDVPPHLDLVRNAIVERTQMRPNLPNFLIPIMNDGAGNHYCLDTRHFVAGECSVAFWDHEQGPMQKPKTIATNFPEWLSDQIASLA